MKRRKILKRLLIWRLHHINDKNLMMILGVVVGIFAGLGAVIIKNLVHLIKNLLTSNFILEYHNYLYFAYPTIGIFLALIFIKFVIKKHVGHGIPGVLFAISKTKGVIKRHNIFSSIVTSSLTVGFGGSVGLEGPTVATGAAIGSSLGELFHLKYKQIMLLLSLASAAAMAAIFKSPIAAVVFAIEVIMIDLTMASIVPLLIASATAVLTSYFFLGQAVLYPFEIKETFAFQQFPYFIILGIFAGFVSVYFTKMYIFVETLFQKIKKWYSKLIIGGLSLGILIFMFPALYGEGYEAINSSLHGDISTLFNNSILSSYNESVFFIILLFLLIIFFKAIATSITFGAGGVGGIFAPTLFTGAFTGLFAAYVLNLLDIGHISAANFALVGMGGLIAGVLHAPLTGIFLIAEITGGYELFIPLMITATISYATTKIFVANSVYTHQLAKRGELLTHHKDKVILSMMSVGSLVERNFHVIHPKDSLGDVVKVISKSRRNIFPVVEDDGAFKGIVRLDDVRDIMFQPELYDKKKVEQFAFFPEDIVDAEEFMESVVKKFQDSGKYNLVVVKDGKYVGFVSRANIFSKYRRLIKNFSDD